MTKLDALIYEIIVDANGEDEQLWAFRQAFEDAFSLPADGFVIGEPVAVLAFDYDGNKRRGLIARCRREDVLVESDGWAQARIGWRRVECSSNCAIAENRVPK